MKCSRIRMIAAAAAMAVSLAAAVPSVSALAATGTVTGSDINVRSEASTDGSIVGTVDTGDTVTVGDSATDSSGATWYEVTLSNGTVGYIRSDFLTVTEDEADSAEETYEEESDEGTTDEAVTQATTSSISDTGGYQIVLAPDEDGNETYYLYDNNAGERMKISDIAQLQEDVNEAIQEAADTKNQYRIIVIVLLAAVVILIIVCVVLALKMRDALANGRRERDLTMERRDQRKNNRNADSVETLRRGRGSQEQTPRSGRGRDDAYASGASRRVERDTSAGARRTTASRQDDGYARSTASRESSRRDSDVRSSGYSASEEPVRTARSSAPQSTARRTSSPEYSEGSARRSSSEYSESGSRRSSTAAGERTDASVRRSSASSSSSSPEYSEGSARRSSAEDTAQTSQRRSSASSSSVGSRRSSARNFADDEDFDYDFLSMDDDQ